MLNNKETPMGIWIDEKDVMSKLVSSMFHYFRTKHNVYMKTFLDLFSTLGQHFSFILQDENPF